MLRRTFTAIGLTLAATLALGWGPVRAAEPTIALVTINQQALFFNQMIDGAEAAAKDKGAKLGALNSFIQNQRQKGFEDTIKADKNITVAGVVDGRNIQDNALAAAENLMTGNPDMNTVYATGEPALVGAVAAVDAQGAKDRVKVFGWDLTKQIIRGIDDGYVVAVVQQDPAGEGKAAVEAAVTLVNGGTVPPKIDVPVTIVTKENV